MDSLKTNKTLESGRMLISKDKNIYANIDIKKISNGSFYTKKMSWFTKPIKSFFELSLENNKAVLDPFAGAGDIIQNLSNLYDADFDGYDIEDLGWIINDSLVSVPNPKQALICTNPPYLALHSAKRKRLYNGLCQYYNEHNDLYEAAISACLKTSSRGIFILPETFLHSSFPKNHLESVSVISNNPFNDTEHPVCVACFDNAVNRTVRDSKVYLDDNFVCTLDKIYPPRLGGGLYKSIKFNSPNGNIALKAIDGVYPEDRIRFETPDNFYYDRNNIKFSSRLITYIEVPNTYYRDHDSFIYILNNLLEQYRHETSDLSLSPFKGNNKIGKRRRRLDYRTARYLIQKALTEDLYASTRSSSII